jgi:hypothetical protein
MPAPQRGNARNPAAQSGSKKGRALPRWRVLSTMGAPMFFFFSNRLGCLGSILVSVVLTLLLLLLLGVF